MLEIAERQGQPVRLPDEICVTSRSEEQFGLLRLEDEIITPGDVIVVSGGEIFFEFESNLSRIHSAHVISIDMSMEAKSSEYFLRPSPNLQVCRRINYIPYKNSGGIEPVTTDLVGDQFNSFQTKRKEIADSYRIHLITGKIPEEKISDKVNNASLFLDCWGPGHYISQDDILIYLYDAFKTLKPGGKMIVYPLGTRMKSWTEAIKSIAGATKSIYRPQKVDATMSGIKITKK